MKVKTCSGKMVERDRCRKIKEVFYEIGDVKVKDSGECYKINGRYHRFNNGLIEYDYENQEYVLTNKVPLRRGIVDIDMFGKPVLGFFTSNVAENVNVVADTRTSMLAMNTSVLKDDFKEHYNSGTFYRNAKMSTAAFKAIKRPPVDKNNLIYDSRFAGNMTQLAYDKYYKPKGGNSMIDQLGDFLDSNGITFGVEFETSTGFIPERLCYKHGLIPLRDGSIGGLEYVTIPLSGRKGLYNLMEVADHLKERTKFDFRCSMHIHLGGLKRETENILAINNIACLVEENIYQMQPAYKKNSRQYGKEKEYSAPIKKDFFEYCRDAGKMDAKKIRTVFDALFTYLSMGRSFGEYGRDLNNVESHPSDPRGNRKWNVSPRYAWFNIIPIIFTNKQTVEFRQHNNTFDFFKIFHFILSSAAIVVGANKHSDKFNESGFLKSLSNKANALETIIKYVAKEERLFTDELLESNLRYNKERTDLITELNKTDPEGNNEHKYYSKFTNDING